MLLSDSTVSATLAEKLRWAFKIYDKDMSGEYPIVKVPSFPNLPRLYIRGRDGDCAWDCVRAGGDQPGRGHGEGGVHLQVAGHQRG